MFRQGDPRSQDRRRQLRPLCLTEKSKTYCQEQVNNLLHKIVDIKKFSTRAKGDWRVAIVLFFCSFSLFTFYVYSYHRYHDLNNNHYGLSFQRRPPKKLKFILKTKPFGDTPKIEKPQKSRSKPKNSTTTTYFKKWEKSYFEMTISFSIFEFFQKSLKIWILRLWVWRPIWV